MASFETNAFISQIKYLPSGSVAVFLDEYHRGYTKSGSGEKVDERYLTFKTVWKPYFKKYINEHFNTGMYVNVKGEVLPYAIEGDTVVDGYSVIGQTINRASFPKASLRREIKMRKESELHAIGTPDVEGYLQEDF